MKGYIKKNAFMLTGQALSVLFMGAVMYATLKDAPSAPSAPQVAKVQTLTTN